MSDAYVLVYTPLDEDAPASLRTHTLDEAERAVQRLNGAAGGLGRWTIHELGEALS